ncbi:MAG: cytochrome o ubiquinol oxidase subunit III [Oceanospirillaceae bacterium]|uniref:cytochrome o ubiquinol oxidase subunit III n=1 Tax=unclassified Thalassolituus TaxID=2624967 RepID=UPI000C0A610F|nr:MULTISPECIES: cytochrome o ubiquinol oxidase subunit III [unclassified Thalassolituus]MAK92008.1 cytochrome o ubiquinol oxidase subunit III [Thalassolituus sp.]MAS26483.1 cytochrome o ubiquinol oxidase subunit III [Oceanospirillaceae bacterium]MAX98038.1 cytochrome o ubiquinol oxidase subunit III [Oceanospirillaceae bacterium]MBL34443.1 cytochrome o ubiquinol oxidase subunit III [Oceanospirillaceae bacterium]MBS52696.1 cytochrome o ubiquinol oxidase subunit III [Oceanospirillaceae bacterium
MSTSVMNHDAHEHEHHDSGSTTLFGFWMYLMTDCILFASVFATYAVLFMNTAGGPAGHDIFELDYVLIETFALLFSSITYGFAMIGANRGNKQVTLLWLAVTFVLGAVFIGMEINEFAHLIHEGFGPQRSAFLTAFFSLVGMHGLHVTAGLIWMVALMLEVKNRGLSPRTVTRVGCLSLFWHFLDVVWICVFTVVYLMGTVQ